MIVFKTVSICCKNVHFISLLLIIIILLMKKPTERAIIIITIVEIWKEMWTIKERSFENSTYVSMSILDKSSEHLYFRKGKNKENNGHVESVSKTAATQSHLFESFCVKIISKKKFDNIDYTFCMCIVCLSPSHITIHQILPSLSINIFYHHIISLFPTDYIYF